MVMIKKVSWALFMGVFFWSWLKEDEFRFCFSCLSLSLAPGTTLSTFFDAQEIMFHGACALLCRK